MKNKQLKFKLFEDNDNTITIEQTFESVPKDKRYEFTSIINNAFETWTPFTLSKGKIIMNKKRLLK